MALKWQLPARTLPVEVPGKADTSRHAPLFIGISECVHVALCWLPKRHFAEEALAGLTVP